MKEKTRDRLDKMIDKMSKQIIRIDVTLTHLDPYFMTLFILFWVSSQPIKIKSGKSVAMDLIQAGLQTKFKSERSVIRQKIQTFCDTQGITTVELLDTIYTSLGYEEGDTDQPISAEDIQTDFNLVALEQNEDDV